MNLKIPARQIPERELIALALAKLKLQKANEGKVTPKTLAESSLFEFIQQAWPILEPAAEFVDGWHIRAICDHLEAVADGRIKRLVINIPPRHMKSIAVSVAFPAWAWIARPHLRWLCASYAASLSVRDSVKMRNVINSSWYRRNWPTPARLAGDQNAKGRFENTSSGYRLASSVEGSNTGEGGDVLLIDDPHSTQEALSEVKREAVITWWDQVMSTRLNNPKTGAVVIIMQRVHEADLSGHLLEQGYEHLCLPAEYEGENRCRTSLGFVDPRRVEGELLWPERFGEAELVALKRSLGSYAAAGQLQQRPAPLKGGIVQLDWFRRYTIPPRTDEIIQIVQFWDTAQKANEVQNAPWVGITAAQTATSIYILDVYRAWHEYPAGKRAVQTYASKWSPSAIIIENKSTGSSLIQELIAGTPLPVIGFEPEGDKITRMSTETPAIEAGHVYLPESAPWLHEFEHELSLFPNSVTMDQADALSMALKYFRTTSYAGARWV